MAESLSRSRDGVVDLMDQNERAEGMTFEPRGDKPRLRTRLAGFLAALVALSAVLTFINSAYFVVSDAEVTGNSYLSESEVILMAGVPYGRSIFRVDTRAMERELMRAARIASAHVTRKLPGSIRIEIVERHGAGLIPYAGYFVEVDSEGVALGIRTSIEAAGATGMPLIAGIRPTSVTVGQAVQPEEQVKAGAKVADILMESGLVEVSDVDVSDPDSVVVHMVGGIKILLGPLDGVRERAKLAAPILSSCAEKGLDVEYIDLRVASRPVVRERR